MSKASNTHISFPPHPAASHSLLKTPKSLLFPPSHRGRCARGSLEQPLPSAAFPNLPRSQMLQPYSGAIKPFYCFFGGLADDTKKIKINFKKSRNKYPGGFLILEPFCSLGKTLLQQSPLLAPWGCGSGDLGGHAPTRGSPRGWGMQGG